MDESVESIRAKKIEETLLELVAIPSITGTEGEAHIAGFIYDKLDSLDYFKDNSSYLRLVSSTLPDIQGPLHNVFALVKALKPTKKTIVLISHFDVVDVQNYGSLKHLAFDPRSLTMEMADITLPPDAKKDLDTGNYLFGRGVMDMKLGLALEMELVEAFSKDTTLFDVNIALLAVGDEENNNGGMRVGAQFLKQACDEFDLDLTCVVNTEPSDGEWFGTKNPMIFLGTTGKLLPFFYILGAPSHAGSYYQGVSASLLASFLQTIIEGNPSLADSDEGETMPPPLGLGFELRDREYSVTLPDKATIYFNYFFLKKKPSQIIEEMTSMVQEAIDKTRAHISLSYKEMAKKGYLGKGNEPGISIMTYDDLLAEVNACFDGDLEAYLEGVAKEMPETLDVREKGIRLVEAVLDLRQEATPVIIAGLLPPFLPPRTSLGNSHKELALQTAAENLRAYSQKKYNTPIDKAIYFPGICDLSYAGSDFEPKELATVVKNTPGWGDIYTIPFEEIAALDTPVINIGPMGKDAHKMTERLEKNYACRILPDLLRYFIRQF